MILSYATSNVSNFVGCRFYSVDEDWKAIINGEYVRIWKGIFVACLKVLPRYSLRETLPGFEPRSIRIQVYIFTAASCCLVNELRLVTKTVAG
jgi:hypothetical protein